jgi:ketosteroid isomerase-like protein
MTRQENEAVARSLTDAFAAMDMARLDALIADDVVCPDIRPRQPRRRNAAMQAVAPGVADYQITGKLHDIVASDDHAIALIEATATRGGKTLTYRTAEIYHIKNGHVVERWAFSDDTAAITAFFA